MAVTKKYKKNEIIFEEGTLQMTMYDIVSGKVGIYSYYGTPNQKLLVELEDGKTFGELGLIERVHRSATAVALEATTVNEIDDEGFEQYFASNPLKLFELAKGVSNRTRQLTYEYVDACNTLKAYMKASENNEPKSYELMDKMKKFIDLKNRRKYQ